jgi:ADP-ribosylglycohydrolase
VNTDHVLRFTVMKQSRVRGLLLGLALGETVGAARGRLPAAGPLRAGVSTQLACFTAEGVIRARVRGHHKGICHPPSVALHAYCRWAALQGIEREKLRHRWQPYGGVWPDGWLAGVEALGERRGSAPATVTALSRIDAGVEAMPTASRGHHALTRTLPLAAVGPNGVAQAAEFAALTHGDPAAQAFTTHGTALAHHCLNAAPAPDGSAREALRASVTALPASTGDADRGLLAGALAEATEHPADTARLARLAPDPTAPAALLGGLYAAASFPARADVRKALDFAATAPDGESVACVAGALLGAAHGAEALPTPLLARHELTWPLDTLARDLVTELEDSPGGGEYVPAWDPHWLERYPGW